MVCGLQNQWVFLRSRCLLKNQNHWNTTGESKQNQFIDNTWKIPLENQWKTGKPHRKPEDSNWDHLIKRRLDKIRRSKSVF